MRNDPLPRLDTSPEIRERILPYCRLKPGEVWSDPLGRHRVGCLDAAREDQIKSFVGSITDNPDRSKSTSIRAAPEREV
jgi:site-specific DNA-methyltransferase (adenine-specific)